MLTADPWQPGAVENQDPSVNSASNPAAVGTIVSIYATGAGPLDATALHKLRAFPAHRRHQAPVNAELADAPDSGGLGVKLAARRTRRGT